MRWTRISSFNTHEAEIGSDGLSWGEAMTAELWDVVVEGRMRVKSTPIIHSRGEFLSRCSIRPSSAQVCSTRRRTSISETWVMTKQNWAHHTELATSMAAWVLQLRWWILNVAEELKLGGIMMLITLCERF